MTEGSKRFRVALSFPGERRSFVEQVAAHLRAALAEARRLVEKHGYGRRREELDDLEALAAGW